MDLLQKGYYFTDPKDVEFAGATIAWGLTTNHDKIDNIGDLNKRRFNVKVEDAWTQGGENYRKRAQLARMLIGFAGPDSIRYQQEKINPPALPASVQLNAGQYNIDGVVRDITGAAVAGTLVKLQMVIPSDSAEQSLIAYARTDAGGKFSFIGLPANKAFRVLPLKPGYQFGAAKGVSSLDENTSFNFTQSVHTMRLFSTRDFNNLKKEKALIVRLPKEVSDWFWIIVGTFFACFLLLHVFLSLRFAKADQLILPVIMLLTGLSLLTLLSLQDPLRDRFLARSTLWYFITGFVGLNIILLFDLRKFRTDSGLFRLFYFK